MNKLVFLVCHTLDGLFLVVLFFVRGVCILLPFSAGSRSPPHTFRLGGMMFTVQDNWIHWFSSVLYPFDHKTHTPAKCYSVVIHTLVTRSTRSSNVDLLFVARQWHVSTRSLRARDTSLGRCYTVLMRQSHTILSLVTRQMCPPRPRMLEIERFES